MPRKKICNSLLLERVKISKYLKKYGEIIEVDITSPGFGF